MTDHPRVSKSTSIRTSLLGSGEFDEYTPNPEGAYKVVPADAIVIERGDLPEPLKDWERELLAGAGQPEPRMSADEAWSKALGYIAEAEYARANPPVDEAQVEALGHDLSAAGFGNWQPIARHLVSQGWSKAVTE